MKALHTFLLATVLLLALTSLQQTTQAQTATVQKEAHTPENWPDPPAHVSWVTTAHGFAFCTGMLGLDLDTFELVDDTFEQEARQLLENLRAMVESAGATTDDLVQVTVYLTDLDLYPTLMRLMLSF